MSKDISSSYWFWETVTPHFIQQFGPDDRVAYRSVGTLLTGHARRGDDQLCIRFEGYFLDRVLCGEIYRNPAGDAQSRYVYVSPDALRSQFGSPPLP